MAKYQFNMGQTKESQVQFNLTDNGLTMEVMHSGEQYNLKFLDGILNERITSDWFAEQNGRLYDAFSSDSEVAVNGNTIEFVTVPKHKASGIEVSNVKIVNRFTVSETKASVIQETFYDVSGLLYDCSHVVGKVEIDLDQYDMVENEEAGFSFVIRDLQKSNIGYPKGVVLKGKNKTLRVDGGLAALCGKTIDAHVNTINYNDTLSFYDENNSIFTVYSFGETKKPVLPERKVVAKKPTSEIFKLESGDFGVELAIKNDGIAHWHKGREYPIVALGFRKLATGEMVYFNTVSDWKKVVINKNTDNVEFLLSEPKGILDISLKLTAQIISEQSRIEWDVKVINDSCEYSLLWCTYPQLYCDCPEVSNLFLPEGGGTDYTEFSCTDNHYNGSYPGGFMGVMAYMALYPTVKSGSKSIYYAVHDETGCKKEFQAASTQIGTVRLTCRYYAENWGEPKNSNHLYGKTVWQSYQGDWYEATNIYREFIRNECFWAKRNIDDKKTPLWMQDLPLWIMDWVPVDPGEEIPTNLRTDSDVIRPEDWYENVIKLQKEIGTPIGYHVYNWHKIPFNNDYPHFLPARESFKKGMKELKKYDIRIMPYINALLWDTKDRRSEDFEFEEYGRPGAVKIEDGTPAILKFESREANGELVQLTAMCPSYEQWKEKMVKLTKDMYTELDIDGIYLDQISARIPHLCMDASHNHPKGGGHWWTKEYNDLLKKLNDNKPSDKIFTSEANAEVYASQLDGFLSWTWVKTINDVPAFMRVYSDIIIMLGRNTNGYIKLSDMHWKYNFAQSLVCGQQLGWINSDVVKMPNRLEFIKKLIRFRYEHKEFFRNPTILRPPVVEAEKSHIFHSDIGMSYVGVLSKPYICAGTLENENVQMIVIVNTGTEDMTDVITFNPNEYNIGKDYEIIGDGKIEILEDGKVKCTVAKENYIAIKWEK